MKLEYPSKIFENPENEFKKFINKDTTSLIHKYYSDKNLSSKHSKNSKGYETIGVYKGKVVNGPTFVMYNKGNFYFGNVVDGVKQGEGDHLYPNGFLFQGKYSNDQKISGKVIDGRDGKEIYVGNWEKDNYGGKGWLRNPFKEYIYEGNFVNGLFDGYGRLTYNDGSYYEGSFSSGQQNGFGKLVLLQSEYEGNFKNSKPHGKGFIKFTNGDKYTGDFENGKISGSGKLTDGNFSIDGTWVGGSMQSGSYMALN